MAGDVDLYSCLISTVLSLLCFFILEVHPLQYPVILVESSNIMHIERELINRILLNCCLSSFLGSFSSRRDVKWDCCRLRSTNFHLKIAVKEITVALGFSYGPVNNVFTFPYRWRSFKRT